jgi:hypothetical protein
LGLTGLHAQPWEDTGLSPAEADYGAPIVLPNEFLQGGSISADTISIFFFIIFGCSCVFFAKAQFESPAAEGAPRLISSEPASYGSGAAAWFPLSTLTMMAPTLSSAKDPLRLHSPGRAAGGDHCCEPPPGVHSRGRHACHS